MILISFKQSKLNYKRRYPVSSEKTAGLQAFEYSLVKKRQSSNEIVFLLEELEICSASENGHK
jgi:hypothetical protein